MLSRRTRSAPTRFAVGADAFADSPLELLDLLASRFASDAGH
jgi:hypothetical protein